MDQWSNRHRDRQTDLPRKADRHTDTIHTYIFSLHMVREITIIITEAMKHTHTTNWWRILISRLKKLNSPQMGTHMRLPFRKKKFSGHSRGCRSSALPFSRSALEEVVTGMTRVEFANYFTTCQNNNYCGQQSNLLLIHSLLTSGCSSQVGRTPGPRNCAAILQVLTHISSLKDKQSSLEMVRRLLSGSHSGNRVRQRKGRIAPRHSSLAPRKERPFTRNIACSSLESCEMEVGMLRAEAVVSKKHSCKETSSSLQTSPE